MKRYQRDPEDMALALSTYSPAGVEVDVPGAKRGIIEEQIHEAQGAAFRVRLQKPVPFDTYAEKIGVPSARFPMEEFQQRFGFDPEQLFPAGVPDIVRERGISRRDILFDDMIRTGCLDIDQNVVCVVIPWRFADISFDKIQMGTPIEYTEDIPGRLGATGAIRVFAGRLLGKKGGTVYVELVEPVTLMRGPELLMDDDIKEEFALDVVWAVGAGLAHALEDAGELPEGTWSDDQVEYRLENAIPLSAVKKFCNEAFPKNRACWLQALTLFVVPLELSGDVDVQGSRITGSFRPMRQDSAGYYEGQLEVEFEQ